MSDIKGFLEKYNSSWISGWAQLPPEGPDSILELIINNEVVAEISPSYPRPDFSGSPLGFSIALPREVVPATACRVEVRTKGSKTHISNSPVIVLLATENDRRQVLVGKDSYLFLTNDTNRVIDQIRGIYDLDPSAIENWKAFARKLDQLSNFGIDCYYLVVPNKECVYQDLLPNDIKVAEDRPFAKVANVLLENWRHYSTRFKYPINELMLDEHAPSFPRGDTHWTSYGAFVALDSLFGGTYPNEVAELRSLALLKPVSYRYENADLLSKLGGACIEQKPSSPLKSKAKKIFDNNVINGGQECSYFCETASVKKKVLVYHDSFGQSLVPWMTNLFSEVETVWSPSISLGKIETCRPDILVIERVERFLVHPSSIE